MKSFRLLAALLVTASLAACSDTTTGVTGPASPNFAKGGGSPTPTPVTGINIAGVWTQSPASHTVALDGSSQDLWYRMTITQNGSQLGGEVRRFITTYDANGNTTFLVAFDLGSPGKITGTVSGNTANINFVKVNETKTNYSYRMTISADANGLTVNNPIVNGPTAFTR